MSKTYAIKPNENWAENTSNKTLSSNPSVLGQGIEFQGGVVSNQLNGVLNKHSNAIRKSQAQGGLYDNEQIYNKNEFAEILTADNGIVRSRRYQAISDNTTASYPPVNGSKNTYSGIDVYSGTLNENPSRWARVLEDHRFTKSTSLSSGYGYTLCSNTPSNAEGTLRCRIYNGSTLYCSFDLEIVGGYRNFRIKNVFYHDAFRNNKQSSSYSDLYYPGFALLNGQSGLYLHILTSYYANRLEVEFGTCNFIPPLSSSSGYTPSSTLQIQAIREGGGSMFIPNLGAIIPTMHSAYQSNQRDFALFQSGLKLWTSSMSLDGNYFHQLAKYGFRMSYGDPTNRYLKASTATPGDFGNQSLPNIKGLAETSSWNGHPLTCTDGAFYSSRARNWLVDFNEENSHSNGALGFDASLSNQIYQDSANVHPNHIYVTYAIQAF